MYGEDREARTTRGRAAGRAVPRRAAEAITGQQNATRGEYGRPSSVSSSAQLHDVFGTIRIAHQVRFSALRGARKPDQRLGALELGLLRRRLRGHLYHEVGRPGIVDRPTRRGAEAIWHQRRPPPIGPDRPLSAECSYMVMLDTCPE